MCMLAVYQRVCTSMPRATACIDSFHAQVQQILAQPVSVTACAQSTGWLTDDEQKLVQQVVKERLDALFSQ